MERVHTLIEKLQQQVAENASADKLLATVQMLQSELLQQKGNNVSLNRGKVSVMMPGNAANNSNKNYQKQEDQSHEEKIIEVLKVDEKEIEEELEEIKRNAEAKNQMSVNAKPSFLF